MFRWGKMEKLIEALYQGWMTLKEGVSATDSAWVIDQTVFVPSHRIEKLGSNLGLVGEFDFDLLNVVGSLPQYFSILLTPPPGVRGAGRSAIGDR